MRKNLELRHEMFEIIEQWQQSGLTKKAFCEQQPIRHHSFFYWHKCYRQHHAGIDNYESAFLKLQRLHSLGLLKAAFIPSEDIEQIRTYHRYRTAILVQAASSIQKMQKALRLMIIRLDLALSDITGLS